MADRQEDAILKALQTLIAHEFCKAKFLWIPVKGMIYFMNDLLTPAARRGERASLRERFILKCRLQC